MQTLENYNFGETSEVRYVADKPFNIKLDSNWRPKISETSKGRKYAHELRQYMQTPFPAVG